jgi:hypothetical protein
MRVTVRHHLVTGQHAHERSGRDIARPVLVELDANEARQDAGEVEQGRHVRSRARPAAMQLHGQHRRHRHPRRRVNGWKRPPLEAGFATPEARAELEVVLVRVLHLVRPRAADRAANDLARETREHHRLGCMKPDIGRRARAGQAADAVRENARSGERRLVHLAHVLREPRQALGPISRSLRGEGDVVVVAREQGRHADRDARRHQVAAGQEGLVAPGRIRALRAGQLRRERDEYEEGAEWTHGRAPVRGSVDRCRVCTGRAARAGQHADRTA